MSQAGTCDSKDMLLSARGVFKTFGLNAVLKGIDLDVGKGEVLALIGGNGAGKSTLMKIIMGIYQPDEGELVIAGGKINTFKPSVILAKGVYMVPQEPMLFPNMTVEENVLIGFKEKTGPLRKRLIQIMDDIGWHLDLTRKAMSLSIAEQQLVELLRGLLRNARVLILDEPTAGLDPQGVSDIMRLLAELRGRLGMTIIIATHDMDIVPLYCDYAYLLNGGKIAAEGTTEALFSQPELLRENHLRLPRIAHLMEILRDRDGLDADRSAATIGAARREINRLLQET